MSLRGTITAPPGMENFFRAVIQQVGDYETLNKIIATEAANLTREYLLDANEFRHATADRLGARPTQHFAKVARAVEYGFDEKEAYIEVPTWSGLGRAFGDVEITPKNGKKWLTIAANARTYGRSAREFDNLQFVRWGNAAALVAESLSDRSTVVMYWLARKVNIKQDRTLLPSNEAYFERAREGSVEWLRLIISRKGGLSS